MRETPVLCLWLAIGAASAQTYVSTTVAGGGPPDGISALEAAVVPAGFGSGIATDSSGNVYFTSRNRVFRISPEGTLATAAGNGTGGFSGDGGPAREAMLNQPTGLAVDAAGNLYIADTQNFRVRMVFGGIITTVAGTGASLYSGDNRPATSAGLYPVAVAVDGAGNLYIADAPSNRVRRVSEGIISTVADSLTYPNAVAVDGAGNVYTGDTSNVIRKISGGVVSTITAQNVKSLASLAADSAGALYLADAWDNRVRKLSAETDTTLANGEAGLSFPTGVAVDPAGRVYIVDRDNHRILRVSGGAITTVAGNGALTYAGDGGPATSAEFESPSSVAVSPDGMLLVADAGAVRMVSEGMIKTIATGQGAAVGSDPAGNLYYSDGRDIRRTTGETVASGAGAVGVDAVGNFYLSAGSVVDRVSDSVLNRVAGNGVQGYAGDAGLATDAELRGASRVAIDAAGNLYFADRLNHAIRKVSDGIITTVAGNGRPGFSGDGGEASAAELNSPRDVAVDSAGNLYIADTGNDRVRKISQGIITTIAGADASLKDPQSVAVDGAGNVYVADTGNLRVRKLTPATAEMVSPAPGSTLAGSTVTFSWTAAAGADGYWLDVGSIPAGDDLSSGGTTDTSMAVAGLPCDGRTVYVQLWFHLPGEEDWTHRQQYVYTASNCVVVARISSPEPGSRLANATLTFSWDPVPGADNYRLEAAPGFARTTPSTSVEMRDLPCDGRMLLVRLATHANGAWQPPQTYAYGASATCGTVVARMVRPTPGITLSGSRDTFSWTPLAGADRYRLDLGTGPGASDLASFTTAEAFQNVAGLACNGQTIYVQLATRLDGVWQTPLRYAYQAPSDDTCRHLAELQTPAPGSVLPGATASFTWSRPGPSNVWVFLLGSAPGASDYAQVVGETPSATVDSLPCDGRPVFASLLSVWRYEGAWGPQEYVFTAASGCR